MPQSLVMVVIGSDRVTSLYLLPFDMIWSFGVSGATTPIVVHPQLFPRQVTELEQWFSMVNRKARRYPLSQILVVFTFFQSSNSQHLVPHNQHWSSNSSTHTRLTTSPRSSGCSACLYIMTAQDNPQASSHLAKLLRANIGSNKL